jgi:hypothetical protein
LPLQNRDVTGSAGTDRGLTQRRRWSIDGRAEGRCLRQRARIRARCRREHPDG